MATASLPQDSVPLLPQATQCSIDNYLIPWSLYGRTSDSRRIVLCPLPPQHTPIYTITFMSVYVCAHTHKVKLKNQIYLLSLDSRSNLILRTKTSTKQNETNQSFLPTEYANPLHSLVIIFLF